MAGKRCLPPWDPDASSRPAKAARVHLGGSPNAMSHAHLRPIQPAPPPVHNGLPKPNVTVIDTPLSDISRAPTPQGSHRQSDADGFVNYELFLRALAGGRTLRAAIRKILSGTAIQAQTNSYETWRRETEKEVRALLKAGGVLEQYRTTASRGQSSRSAKSKQKGAALMALQSGRLEIPQSIAAISFTDIAATLLATDAPLKRLVTAVSKRKLYENEQKEYEELLRDIQDTLRAIQKHGKLPALRNEYEEQSSANEAGYVSAQDISSTIPAVPAYYGQMHSSASAPSLGRQTSVYGTPAPNPLPLPQLTNMTSLGRDVHRLHFIPMTHPTSVQSNPSEVHRPNKCYADHQDSRVGTNFHSVPYPLSMLPYKSWAALHNNSQDDLTCASCHKPQPRSALQRKLFLVAERLSWQNNVVSTAARERNEETLWTVNAELEIYEPAVEDDQIVIGGRQSRDNALFPFQSEEEATAAMRIVAKAEVLGPRSWPVWKRLFDKVSKDTLKQGDGSSETPGMTSGGRTVLGAISPNERWMPSNEHKTNVKGKARAVIQAVDLTSALPTPPSSAAEPDVHVARPDATEGRVQTLQDFYSLLDKLERTSPMAARFLEAYAERLRDEVCGECWLSHVVLDDQELPSRERLQSRPPWRVPATASVFSH
jgi:hypothetical protein